MNVPNKNIEKTLLKSLRKNGFTTPLEEDEINDFETLTEKELDIPKMNKEHTNHASHHCTPRLP